MEKLLSYGYGDYHYPISRVMQFAARLKVACDATLFITVQLQPVLVKTRE
tara:strand:+ start:1972 stop:2121 length:150 start_codon:yes stop_codon:yes gene_type:complete